MVNKFNLIGELQEASVAMSPSLTKIKMAVKVDNAVITLYGMIQRKYNPDYQRHFNKVVSSLQTLGYSHVYVNNEIYYTLGVGQPSLIFASGNLSPSGDMLFYNMEYVDIVEQSKRSHLYIELEGQWVEYGKFLNVIGDSPRVFDIKPPKVWRNDCIYKLSLKYNCGYAVIGNIVQQIDGDRLTVYEYNTTDKRITPEDIKQYMLEWSIINE